MSKIYLSRQVFFYWLKVPSQSFLKQSCHYNKIWSSANSQIFLQSWRGCFDKTYFWCCSNFLHVTYYLKVEFRHTNKLHKWRTLRKNSCKSRESSFKKRKFLKNIVKRMSGSLNLNQTIKEKASSFQTIGKTFKTF